MTMDQSPYPSQRFYEIDFWKGVGCLCMVMSHPLRWQMVIEEAGGPPMPLLAKWIVQYIDIGAVFFFMASGVNVLSFVRRNLGKPDFEATRFYLLQAFCLFFMGYTYSLALGTAHLGVPDIFQGIALGMIATYLLLAWRAPNWAIFVAAAIMFGAAGFVHAVYPHTKEGFEALNPAVRFLFNHFSFFPWAGMLMLGAMLYRVQSRKWLMALGVFFAFLLAGGLMFTSRPIILDHYQMMFRADASYVTRNVSVAFLLMLVFRQIYQGPHKNRVLALLEYTGKESFLFLVHHFAVIFFLVAIGGQWMNPFLRMGLAVVVTFATLKKVADYRNRISRKPGFVKKAMLPVLIFSALSIWQLVAGRIPASMILAFPATYAFSFVFPSIRIKLKALRN